MKTTRVGGGHPGYLVRADAVDGDIEGPRAIFQQDLWHYTLARMVDACATYGIYPYYGPFGDITDVVACDLSDASPDEDAGGDGILSPDETWTFHCSTKLTETTTNEACVEAEVVDLQPTIVAQFVEACSENTVEVSEPGSPTPEGSVGGGTGTPAPSIPNTAISQIGFGGPLASVIFGAILLASLGTLAYANVRSTRERR